MRDRRAFTRYVLQEAGRIIIDGTPHDCTVYDKSKTGARLIKFGELALPPAFLLQHGTTAAHPCWLIWQAEGEASACLGALYFFWVQDF